jgi:hypothetical protein
LKNMGLILNQLSIYDRIKIGSNSGWIILKKSDLLLLVKFKIKFGPQLRHYAAIKFV